MNKTCAPENQFTFNCPVFKANVKIASCLELRDRVYRGDEVPVRKGCQVALHACKCPMVRIVTVMVRMKDDPYHSIDATKINGLRQEILDDIAPVLIMDRAIDESMANDAEKAAMRKRNDEARAGQRMSTKTVYTPPPKKVATPSPTAAISAAASGDLSAAINTERAA